MPDAGIHGGSVIPKGETETILASAERANGNVTTAEFDMKGAVVGIFVQDGRLVDNASRTATGTPVTWTAGDQADTIDNNLSNGVERNPNTSSEMKHDWGSIATRSLTAIGYTKTVSLNPANSITMSIDFSDDDVAYSNAQTLGSAGGAPKTNNFNIDLTAQSFRFTRLRPSVQAADTRALMRELTEKATIGGKTELTFEVRDTARSDWKVLPLVAPLTIIDPINSAATVTGVDQIGQGQINEIFLPTADTAGIKFIRAVLTTSLGVSDTSVVLIKVNTHV